jgi:hypothetical protein
MTAARISGSLRALALLLLIAIGATGCSTKFIYDRIDWFIVWKVQGYVSLNDAQQLALKTDIQERLDVVRRDELPVIATLANQIARDVESGYVPPELIDIRYYEVLTAYDGFMLGIVPLSQRFLAGLEDDQLEEFFGNLADVNDEMYEEYSGRTPEEREENRNKSAIKGMQEYTGRLSEEQREIIRSGLARMEDASEQWIANQAEWQQRFRELAETRPDEVIYMAELTQLLVYPRHFHTEEYLQRVERNRVIFNVLLADLLNSLNERQRGKAVRKLDGYIQVLTRLSTAD